MEEMTKKDLLDKYADKLEEKELPMLSFPVIQEGAYFGITKEITTKACEFSEAPKIGVFSAFIAHFSAMVGRDVYFPLGDFDLHCRPFQLLVGKSGKARKGTSEYLVERVFIEVNKLIAEPLAIHSGGLSSGEGVVYAIRDRSENKKEIDEGVPDKRLLVIESEFANVLVNCKRESSILSGILRNLFDGKRIAPLTKNNRIQASAPHVTLMGHITSSEFKRKIKSSTEASNGLLNRFLIFMVRRDKLCALPRRTSQEAIKGLADQIAEIVNCIKRNPKLPIEMTLSVEAKDYWENAYKFITAEHEGIIGDLSSRHDTYILMLSMIFALLDKRFEIHKVDIERACIWIDYAQQSLRYLFSSSEAQAKEEELQTLADSILEKLKEQPMSRSEIRDAFNRHKKSSEIQDALSLLLNQSPPMIKKESINTSGRSKEVFSCL